GWTPPLRDRARAAPAARAASRGAGAGGLCARRGAGVTLLGALPAPALDRGRRSWQEVRAATAYRAGAGPPQPHSGGTMDLLITLVPLAAIAALVVAGLLARSIMAAPTGNERMVAISDAVRQGAAAYMNRQYRTIAVVAVVIAAVFAIVALTSDPGHDRTLWWWTTVGFLVGALFSAISGYVGMNVAVRANVRVAQAARSGL